LEAWELRQRQSLPLEAKIILSQQRIREWYEHWDGQVYVSFSGGKDSTVLLRLVRELYPEVQAVFVDTGLEFPEIREFVKTVNNVVWLKPEMNFKRVIEKYGYPIVSKDVARIVHYAKKGSQWALNKLDGINNDGSHSVFKQRYKKWKHLIDAPFDISDECCYVIKKRPIKLYEKESKARPFVGMMAGEAVQRKRAYLETGCNGFGMKRPRSMPLGFWTEQDVLLYLKDKPLSKIYGNIVTANKGGLITTGEARTGCMWCMFGCHLDKVNRFQRMAKTHPKQYDYCINKLGLGEVLDYIGVDYRRNNLFD